MKLKKPKVKREIPPDQLNLSIHREILRLTGDLVSAMVAEYICYRFTKNDRKKVYLKTDWIYEAVPFVSRSNIGKILKKLTKGNDPMIQMEIGKGKHYHKRWYTPSDSLLAGYEDKEITMVRGKVYYNKEIAAKHLEASVVYATIINLLKLEPGWWEEAEHARKDNKLTLNTQKLAEGSGLTLYAVRRGLKWLIDNKKIESKKVFGNKLMVWLPEPEDAELPSESYVHDGDIPEEPSEIYPHQQ